MTSRNYVLLDFNRDAKSEGIYQLYEMPGFVLLVYVVMIESCLRQNGMRLKICCVVRLILLGCCMRSCWILVGQRTGGFLFCNNPKGFVIYVRRIVLFQLKIILQVNFDKLMLNYL
jgi:hypothetical protein